MAPRLATALSIRSPWADVVEQATIVDAFGYDSIWVPEVAGRDALVTCAALAPHVSLTLATGIVPMPVRAPATLAMGAAALAEITGGRFVLGVGLGHRETLHDWFGLKGPLTIREGEEYLRIVRGTLHNGRALVRGERYSADFRLNGAHPPSPPKIILAALGPRGIELATRLADGVVLNWVTPEGAAALVAGLPEGFEVACYVPACVTDDVDAARHELERQIDAYGRLAAYDRVLETRDPDALGAHGSVEQVTSRLQEYRDAGVTLPVLVPYPVGEDGWGSVAATWSLLASESR